MALSAESIVHGSKATPQDLPSTDLLLRSEQVRSLSTAHGHTLVAGEARALIDALRAQALAGTLPHAAVTAPALGEALARRVRARLAPRMRRV
ncbi:MAG TPA: L-seryl-tRNA(Sec) selenium transferase, partial [Burkholderiaceae bacterium]|nr:L-seryl-tRNA(Sec) selenium transferase [Burkholderiaceae bacterium]